MLNAAAPCTATAVLPLLIQPPAASLALGWSPSSLIPGWESDGATISFPLASIAGLTAAAADPITGDARELIWRMVSLFFGWHNARIVTGDAPEAVSLKLVAGGFKTSNPFVGYQKMEVTTTAYVAFPDYIVSDEP